MSETKIKKTILIVEDEEMIRDALTEALERRDFAIYKAADGQEGMLQAIKIIPDLILLDILMPKMDGRAVLKELRANEKTKHIPVMLLTNVGELDMVAGALDAQASGYILKADWSIDEIVDKIEKQIS